MAPLLLADPASFERARGVEFIQVEGSGKTSVSFGWDDLAQLLTCGTLQPAQVMMWKGGKEVPPQELFTFLKDPKRAFPFAALNASNLSKHLLNGATLVIDKIDRSAMPISRMAQQFEEFLETKVQINLYASMGTEPAFDLHSDDHEVIVLQAAGCKHWTVYEPSIPNGVDKPAWTGVINEGDELYIPRGWPHRVAGCGNPFLHLTVSVSRLTAAALLIWAIQEMQGMGLLDEEVPVNAGGDLGRRFLERISAPLQSALTSPEFVERFVRHNRQIFPRHSFGESEWPLQGGTGHSSVA